MATRVEWDENKNRANRRKHGIDFETAARIFADPCAVMRHDRDTESERRWHTIGALDGGGFPVLLVVHTIRIKPAVPGPEDETVIRIISARRATRNERKTYEESEYLN